MLKCSKCKQFKLETEFNKNSSLIKRNGYDYKCRACHNFTQRKIDQNRSKERKKILDLKRLNSSRLRKYNISNDDYNQMHATQNGLCKICKQTEKIQTNKTGRMNDLAIDHCHTTNKVRGLLCIRCNTSLGKFDDNIDNIKRAISHLDNNLLFPQRNLKKIPRSDYFYYRNYKILREDVELIKQNQGYKCNICLRKKSNLHVDHCHRTGKIRGLLCFSCNTALGALEDNKKLLSSMIDYLQISITDLPDWM